MATVPARRHVEYTAVDGEPRENQHAKLHGERRAGRQNDAWLTIEGNRASGFHCAYMALIAAARLVRGNVFEVNCTSDGMKARHYGREGSSTSPDPASVAGEALPRASPDAQPGPAGPVTNALVFVQIPTHFREMIRVAELLQDAPGYRPTVLFMTEYAGLAQDAERCAAQGIAFLAPRDFGKYQRVARRGVLARFLGTVLWTLSSPDRAMDRLAAGIRYAWRLAWWVFHKAVRASPSWVRRVGARLRVASAPLRGTWFADIVRAAGHGVREVIRIAVLVALRLPWRALRAVARFVARGIAKIAAAAKRGIGSIVRSVLQLRVPRLEEARWLRALPESWQRTALSVTKALISIIGLALLPLRAPARWVLLRGFGHVYRNHPRWLPADIRAQRFLWGIVDRMLAANDVDLLVLPEDNLYYFTNLFIRAAHERNAAAVIVPFTVVNTLEWSEAFHRLPSHDAEILVNWLIAKLFPRWRHEHKGRRLVKPVLQVLANEYLGIAPPMPWLINSGAADAIAVESTFMHRYYSQAGIPAHQLQPVGSLADDVLHRFMGQADTRRKALNARLGFAFDRPLIVCALPPNQLLGDGRPTCSIQDFREILRCFVEPLERFSDRYNVVVSLHPRILEDDARVLEGRELRVAPDNIAELVPLASIYVACSSATIRLANACAVPVVNFDVYRYGYGDFEDVPGVITIEEKDEYFAAVARLAGSAEEWARVQRRQAEFVAQETLFDGSAGRRTLALFDRVVAERRAARA